MAKRTNIVTLSAAIGLLALGLWACEGSGPVPFKIGAPVDSADQVGDIFQNNADLARKVTNLCDTISRRQNEPSLAGFSLASEICRSPSSRYQELNKMGPEEPVGFALVNSANLPNPSPQAADDKLLRLQTRSQVWLNRSLLQLVQVMVKSLEDETGNLIQNGGSGTAGDFAFDIVGKPEFNLKPGNIEFRIDVSLVSRGADNGFADINNQFHIEGRVFDEGIAVTAVPNQAKSLQESLIRGGKIVILILLHAGDVYMDLSTMLDFYSFGVDGVMKQEVLKQLGKGLRMLPDTIAKLERNQSGGSSTTTPAAATPTNTTTTSPTSTLR